MFVIYGQIPSKSNSYKIAINWKNRKPMLVKSQEVKNYERTFALQIPAKLKIKRFNGLFGVKAYVYFKTKASDLDGCLKAFLDCLQKNGIIKNDNNCFKIDIEKRIDKNEPRIEFDIYEIE